MRSDFFIRAAIEWGEIAAVVRAAGPPCDGPLRAAALGMPRELAWCDVLFARGRNAAVLHRLRAILREAFGEDVSTPDEADMLAAAFVILERFRQAIGRRYPAAFARPAA